MKDLIKRFIFELELSFGTEKALGICFEDSAGKRYSLEEGDKMYRNTNIETLTLSSIFQNGDDAICCTNYARHIFNNSKRRVKIHGFKNEDNPTAKIVKENMHPGGHDFAVIEGRFLVDPWIKLVRMKADRIAFDMCDQKDSEYVNDMYGPKDNWKHMVEAENV